MTAEMRISRELPRANAQAGQAVLPAGTPPSQARVAVLLHGASMWVLEAALAVGAIATALLLGVGR